MRNQPPPPGTVLPAACRETQGFRCIRSLIWVALLLQTWVIAHAATTPTFIQEKDAKVTSGTSTRVTLSASATAGSLIVVYLIWNNTGSVSVSDSLGNTYANAVGPTRWSNGKYSAQIFYAINLRGGSETVTATFATKITSFGIIYAHEYSGVSQTAPLDVTAAAVGTTGSLNSGSAATTNATDLLFGGAASANIVTSPGTGYTARSRAQGNLTEDRVVSAQGSYSATATHTAGAWAMQMAAFRGATGVVLSTTPTSLAAVATGTNSINLAWVAPPAPGLTNYVLQRCQGAGCSNFAQIGAPNVPSYADAGLAAGTSYSYRVAAMYPGSGLSAYSNVSGATTLAAPPTAPSNLAASASGPGQISLSWTASSGSSGFTNYVLQRCQGAGCSDFVQIASPVITSYADAGLPADTNFSYRVAALYSSSGLTAYSNVISATTLAPPPTAPSNLAASASVAGQIDLTWAAASPSSGLLNYVLQRCQGTGCSNFTQIASPVTTGYADTGLAAETTFSYRVAAMYSGSGLTAYSNVTNATTVAGPPTAPSNLAALASASGQISLNWSASSPSSGLSNYVLERCQGTGCSNFAQIASPVVPSYVDTGLATDTNFSYRVAAMYSGSGLTGYSNVTNATTVASLPTAPGSLSATASGTTEIDLSWNASTSSIGVTNYVLQRCQGEGCLNFATIATPAVTSYNDTGLSPDTSYNYEVKAVDTAGSSSPYSNVATATTTATQDTQSPTVSLTAPANNQTVSGMTTITANAADDVGVVGVQFQLDGASLGAELTATPYSMSWDTSKTTVGSHQLTAVARDAAGNKTASAAIAVTVGSSALRPYTTNFALSENPISEGGNWINGLANGLDWGDVRTTPGLAFGTNEGNYADPTAVLNGTWGPDQTLQATVHSVNQSDSVFEEVELRLRTTIAPHSITGYEVNFRCSKTGNAYSQIVRWNGPLGNFTYLWAQGGSQFGVADGDIVKATIIGNLITTYINGVQIAQITDNSFATGNPGIGFYLDGGSGINADYGFSSFMASDGTTSGGSGGSGSDTASPSVPTNLAASAVSASQISLNWTASTDNVAVVGYQVFRNGSQIATSTGTSFLDTTVVPGVQYSYAVAAYDAAGNVSDQSVSVLGQTAAAADITPPSIPVNLQSSKLTSTTLTLSWSPSTDDVAVTGYTIFRDGTQLGTTTATTYADTGLTAATTYSYTVTAYDGSGNVSAPSQALLVTTASAPVIAPSFVQASHNQVASGTSTSTTFTSATQAGHTIVVYVIWNNAGSVAITDSLKNTFVNVGAPVSWGSGYSAQVFYASNLVGGTDSITATFKTSVTSFGVLYASEYAGISAVNPIDVTAMASGSTGSLNSGAATTTSPNDLIFGAGVSDNTVTASGSGFVARDLAYGNITEDRVGASVGSYAATATQNGKKWGMQMVAFRSAQ